jgi:hypothetical protein
METTEGFIFHNERHSRGVMGLFGFERPAVFPDSSDDASAGYSEPFFQRPHGMDGVVEGEKVLAQVDHGIEHAPFALQVEHAFVVGEQSPFQEGVYQVFYLPDGFGFVLASEPARAVFVTVVVHEPEFPVEFLEYAEFVEHDSSKIFLEREEERFRPLRQMLGFEIRIRPEKAVRHATQWLNLEEG